MNTTCHFRVLLVTSFSQKGFYIAPPLGLYRLKQCLQEQGFACDILDFDIDDEAEYLERVRCGWYQAVGFSVSHCHMDEDLTVLWRFMEKGQEAPDSIWWMGGGQEATLNYSQWFRAGLDIVFTGFAEDSLCEFCEIAAGRSKDDVLECLSPIPGIIYKNSQAEIVVQPQKALTKERFAEFSYHNVKAMQIPFQQYWEQLKESACGLNFNTSRFVLENVRLYTTSHCPRGCGFCSSQAFLSTSQQEAAPIQFLDAEQVYDLVVHYVRTVGARGFLFSDDDFLIGTTQGTERAMNFCRMIIAGKKSGVIPHDVVVNCQARIADFLDNENKLRTDLVELLREAGFHSFGLGVETFSDRLLQCPSVTKRGIDSQDCKRVLDYLLDAQLDPQINIILGIPETTVDELIHTIKIAMDYIVKGCQVAVTPQMFSIPGAPVSTMRQYHNVCSYRENPFTGQSIEISHYIVPEDTLVANMVDKLPEFFEVKLRDIVKDTQWSDKVIPKSMLGMVNFIAAAELLGCVREAEVFRVQLDELIKRAEQ